MGKKAFTEAIVLLFLALFLSAAYVYLNLHSAKINMPTTSPIIIYEQVSEPTVANQACAILPYIGTIKLNQLPNYDSLPYDGSIDLRGGMICEFTINPTLPVFTFNFIGQSDGNLNSIEIVEGNNQEIIQTINFSSELDYAGPPVTEIFTTVDANFDGYKDLQLVNNCGATGNCSYQFYLYDPAKNKFVENFFLEGLGGSPDFNDTKKQVITSWNTSAAEYEKNTYEYQDGQYILIQSILSADGGVTTKNYSIENSKSKLINSTIIPWERPE